MHVGIDRPGPNETYVRLTGSNGSATVLFSYETAVAFHANFGWKVSENLWSTTTGKHLNRLGVARGDRLPREEFLARLDEALDGLG